VFATFQRNVVNTFEKRRFNVAFRGGLRRFNGVNRCPGAVGFALRSQTSCLLTPGRPFSLPAPSMAPFPYGG